MPRVILIILPFLAVAAVAGRAGAQAPHLDKECIADREAGSRSGEGGTRFDMDQDDPRFEVRSATVTRRLMCGFRGNKLISATESFDLQLVSQDRDDPGFSTGAPGRSTRFYLVCEGTVGTTLSHFVTGQKLSFANNAFTLPCGHMIYPMDVTDPAKAERVSGAYAYKVESASWTVVRGPTMRHPSFEVAIDAVVTNPVETLELRGRLRGEWDSSIIVVDCLEQRPSTKQAQNPACIETRRSR